MYAEEACWQCDGDGCDACSDTGLIYTEEAIRLQLEAKQLKKVHKAAASATSALLYRDDLIRQAHAGGSTIRQIAAAAGLSASRIHQILHRR